MTKPPDSKKYDSGHRERDWGEWLVILVVLSFGLYIGGLGVSKLELQTAEVQG